MFFAVEKVYQLQNKVLVRIPIGVNVLEEFNFIERLVEEIFTILYDLCAIVCVVVMCACVCNKIGARRGVERDNRDGNKHEGQIHILTHVTVMKAHFHVRTFRQTH